MQLQRITPCLWFDYQAEEAAGFYTAIFPKSKINALTYYGDAGREFHGKPTGSVMTATFELDGQSFTALNGGPLFQFNEAISLQVNCKNQQEVDFYWERLAAGGDEKAQHCGWLKDKYGVSWQILPAEMMDMLKDPDHARTQKILAAMMQMKKINIDVLKEVYKS